MKTHTVVPHVVIIGGGFAGVQTAKRLLKNGIRVAITLVSDKDYLTYYPGLYNLVTVAKQSDVVFPFSSLFEKREIDIVQGTFTAVDPVQRKVMITTEGGEVALGYDYLVVALGSVANYFNIPGLQERSLSFKSIDAALKLKSHFENNFAKIKSLNKDTIAASLHTLIVGGGPSGVELAGVLKRYLTKRARTHSIDPRLITIDIVEAAPRLLPMMSEKVSTIAENKLRRLGINVFTNRSLKSEDIDEVVLSDMEIKTNTVIWTAGTAINPLYTTIPGVILNDRKRVTVTEYLTLPTDEHIFIAGDGAATTFSGLAQSAIENGNYIGNTITKKIQDKPLQPYYAHTPAFVIPIGKRWGLFSYKTIVVSGPLVGILRRMIDWRYRFLVSK